MQLSGTIRSDNDRFYNDRFYLRNKIIKILVEIHRHLHVCVDSRLSGSYLWH